MQSIDDADNRQIGWAYVSPLRRERIEAGARALARIDKRRDFHDWREVGQALLELREAAKEQSLSNGYAGKGYNAAWARLVADNTDLAALSELDSATRTNAMWMAEHWVVLEVWHANLEDGVRRLVNHPATVRRRYTEENPLPPKPRSAAIAERETQGEGELDELDETEEAYDLGAGGEAEDAPEEAEITPEEWVTRFEALWRLMPAAVRGDIADRIILWRSENRAPATQQDAPEAALIAEAEHDIKRAVARDRGKKVRTIADRRSSISPTYELAPERLAMVVADALAKPITEGEDIFAGLGDEVGTGQIISPERVLARRPGLGARDSRIIAARLNHPDSDDHDLAKYAGQGATPTIVRRVLNANGFGRTRASA